MRNARVLVAALVVAVFTTAAQVSTSPFGGMPYN
jgi:hypothetical protein